ncbi:aminoglycoside phosphotransferase family protein [Intrasporangium oryzae]|uniref:aminoglycoside phosphotransferase family protein n=1 Tax=Intrasporangium oryzae TaxID=412687 RepID=UPI000556DEBE|nr:aminoglycoside phosphotransferase family protein [Intrasporangium oryzae]
MPMHDDQLDITRNQVRALLRDQAPDWGDAPITAVRASGTVNAIFRVGEALTARFPLRAGRPGVVAAQLEREVAAMAEFSEASPFPSPAPVLRGRPGHGFPLPWSLQTWVPGEVAGPRSHETSDGFAADLATVILALRSRDTGGRTFAGTGRGGDLADHDEWVQLCIARSDGLLDTRAMARLWDRFRELPRSGPDVMSHTDLIPPNLLASGDRLVGILDTGDFRAADPALDLVSAWHLLDGPRRSIVRSRVGSDDLEWKRGKAWAFQQAAGLVWYYEKTNPPMANLGRTTLSRLFEAGVE